MRTGSRRSDGQNFTLTWLPWLLGGGLMALYLLTLNRSLSFVPDWTTLLQQPAAGAKLAGWSFFPEMLAPVYHAVTLPLRLLPEGLRPIALNAFSAICGGLSLVLLARSVALLPHDRTRDQRERCENRHGLLTFSWAWLPPVFAVLMAGLGLSLWEHGTNGTPEMFDLLLFAYVVHNLIAYRGSESANLLYRAALVYGAAVTNNFALIGLFPLFLGALIWLRRVTFFNLQFLGRMSLCGLAGLAFYFWLPLVSTFSSTHSLGFWEMLLGNLQAQKWLLFSLPKYTLLLLGLTSVFPVILFSIKWSSQFGDPSRHGVIVTTAAFHLCHIIILLACVWLALDPEFSPRKLSFGFAFLPLYYLGALNIGYYSGYVLLVSRLKRDRFRAPTVGAVFLERLATVGLLGLLVAAPAILLHRNLPQIRLTNGSLQREFAQALAATLPPGGLILSDEPRRLWMLRDYLNRQQRTHDYKWLITQWLPSEDYQNYLHRQYPDWQPLKPATPKTPVADLDILQTLHAIAQTNTLTYLHPSFGYYFELFSVEPLGLNQQLKPYPDQALLAPPLTPELFATNETFWAETERNTLTRLAEVTRRPDPDQRLKGLEKFYRTIGLKPEANRTATLLGLIYSRSLVSWAGQLHQSGRYESAAHWLQLARDLNPKNVVADINLAFNQKVQRGVPITTERNQSVEEAFGESRSWEQVLTLNGPYDEPSLVLEQGFVFLRGNLLRQAAHSLNRVRLLATNDVASRLWLAQIHLNRNLPDQTLDFVREVRQIAQRTPGLATNLSDLFTLEAAAHLAKKEDAIADQLIETNLAKAPNNFNLLAAAAKTYGDNARHARALEITERMLKLEPDNLACWINKGCFELELSQFPNAISAFNQVLSREATNLTATLYRAIAYLRAEQYDAAIADYEKIQREYPTAFQVDYGLGEIAYRRKDTPTAIRHYEAYLTHAPANTPEARFVADRLAELKGTKPPAPAKPD